MFRGKRMNASNFEFQTKTSLLVLNYNQKGLFKLDEHSSTLLRMFKRYPFEFGVILKDDSRKEIDVTNDEITFSLKQNYEDPENLLNYSSSSTGIEMTNPEMGYFKVQIPLLDSQFLKTGGHYFWLDWVKVGYPINVYKGYLQVMNHQQFEEDDEGL